MVSDPTSAFFGDPVVLIILSFLSRMLLLQDLSSCFSLPLSLYLAFE